MQWVVYSLFAAEKLGITSNNVASMARTSEDPVVRRLLGAEGELGSRLGLPNDWAVQVIRAIGNYAELYDRHLGPSTQLSIPCGLNSSWVDGGLLYAPPAR